MHYSNSIVVEIILPGIRNKNVQLIIKVWHQPDVVYVKLRIVKIFLHPIHLRFRPEYPQPHPVPCTKPVPDGIAGGLHPGDFQA